MAMAEGAFAARGINLEWEDIPEGTGRMCQMLNDNETDLAIILTEGILKNISEGYPIKIAQEYIGSPLQWGIHVAADSTYETVEALEGKKAAISRMGSGSHLMTYVLAEGQGWDTAALDFEIVNNLDGGVQGLTQKKADFFLWEHFTTKPLVDSGVFRRLGDCPTPWPCFVVAVTEAFLEKKPALLDHVLDIINGYTQEFKTIPSIDRTLANQYGIQLADIQEWLGMTRWSQKQIDLAQAKEAYKQLLALGLAKEGLAMERILL